VVILMGLLCFGNSHAGAGCSDPVDEYRANFRNCRDLSGWVFGVNAGFFQKKLLIYSIAVLTATLCCVKSTDSEACLP